MENYFTVKKIYFLIELIKKLISRGEEINLNEICRQKLTTHWAMKEWGGGRVRHSVKKNV